MPTLKRRPSSTAMQCTGLPELARRRNQGRDAAGESGMLSDVDHPGAGALDSGRLCRCRAWHHLRFEVGSIRRREVPFGEDAFCGSRWRLRAPTTYLVTGTLAKCWSSLGIDGGSLQFTPHLLPIPRGILSTIYVKLAKPMAAEDLEQSLREFYAGKPWVRVFGAARLPQIKFSLGTNYCDIGFSLSPDGTRAVLVSCLDNLLKGAAGQAVQNMNLMFGFDEKAGLQ